MGPNRNGRTIYEDEGHRIRSSVCSPFPINKRSAELAQQLDYGKEQAATRLSLQKHTHFR
jgi:hypothetical protein